MYLPLTVPGVGGFARVNPTAELDAFYPPPYNGLGCACNGMGDDELGHAVGDLVSGSIALFTLGAIAWWLFAGSPQAKTRNEAIRKARTEVLKAKQGLRQARKMPRY